MFGFIIKGSRINSGEDDFYRGGQNYKSRVAALTAGREDFSKESGLIHLYIYDHGDAAHEDNLTAEEIRDIYGVMLIKVKETALPDEDTQGQEIRREAMMVFGAQASVDYSF